MFEKLKPFYLFPRKKYIIAKGTRWNLKKEGSQSNKGINNNNNNNELEREEANQFLRKRMSSISPKSPIAPMHR